MFGLSAVRLRSETSRYLPTWPSAQARNSTAPVPIALLWKQKVSGRQPADSRVSWLLDLGSNQGPTDHHLCRRHPSFIERESVPSLLVALGVRGRHNARRTKSNFSPLARGEDRKWQKWEIREGQGPQMERSYMFTSDLHDCFYGPVPLKENPLFPLRLTHRWGEGVAEVERYAPVSKA